MAKMERERAVKERRARKQEKRDMKKRAAAEALERDAGDGLSSIADSESPPSGAGEA